MGLACVIPVLVGRRRGRGCHHPALRSGEARFVIGRRGGGANARGWHLYRAGMVCRGAKQPSFASRPDRAKGGVGRRKPDMIFLPENIVKMLGVSLVEARSAGEPRLLEMQGSLALDTNKLVRVHSRFAGEVIEIATVADDRGAPRQRAARRGVRSASATGSKRISSWRWSGARTWARRRAS